VSHRRVVVTGLGLVSPVGNTVEESWDNIKAGVSGVRLIEDFDATSFATQFSASVRNFNYEDYFTKKEARKMDTFVHFGVAASAQAIEDAGLNNADGLDLERVGVAIGSGIGGLPNIEVQHQALLNGGARKVSPFFVPSTIINMISGNLSIKYGYKGPNVCVVTACTTGTHNIGDATRMIEYGDADVMVAGGAEMATCPLGLAGFGASIYGEVLGYGMSGDAYHMTLPSEGGEGAARCMSAALKNAKLDPSDVDYLNAHGTSTPAGDLAETLAVKTVFGKHSDSLLVSSVFSVLALRDQIAPPTINLDNPGEGCDLDYVPHTSRSAKLSVAMSNSFGFGGTNGTLVFGLAT